MCSLLSYLYLNFFEWRIKVQNPIHLPTEHRRLYRNSIQFKWYHAVTASLFCGFTIPLKSTHKNIITHKIRTSRFCSFSARLLGLWLGVCEGCTLIQAFIIAKLITTDDDWAFLQYPIIHSFFINSWETLNVYLQMCQYGAVILAFFHISENSDPSLTLLYSIGP